MEYTPCPALYWNGRGEAVGREEKPQEHHPKRPEASSEVDAEKPSFVLPKVPLIVLKPHQISLHWQPQNISFHLDL